LAASIVLWIYLALRLGDLAIRGVLGGAFDGSWQSGLFLSEVLFSAVIPATLMLFKPIRSSLAGVGIAASMVVLGMIGHRLNVSIVAFARPEGIGYFPSWEEFAVSFGIVAGGILIFLFFVENLNVFDDVRGHPAEEKPVYSVEGTFSFLPGPLGLPRRYSVAALSGGVLALLFLPVSGIDPRPVPVKGPRSVDAYIQASEDGGPRTLALAEVSDLTTTRIMMLDANRDGDVVLFDHDDHAERLGGERSCETCHHLTKPLDRNTSCSECHMDMYEPVSVFDHDIHAEKLGGNDGCVQCHSDGSEVKSYDTVTECSECHQDEIAPRAFVEAPDPRWGEAVGYKDAMHSLCVDCHEREALKTPGENPEGLDKCMTCHDVDWREDVKRMMPQLRDANRMAVGSVRRAAPSRGAGG
jgi:hypothetical protein